jgi:hypothetical protein
MLAIDQMRGKEWAMSQDGSRANKKSTPRDHPIAVALITAGAVIAAALITVFLSRGGSNSVSLPPSQTTSAAAVTTHSHSPVPSTETTSPASAQISGTITYPGKDATVPEGYWHVAGTVRNLPAGYRLLLFLQWTGDDKYLGGNPYIKPKDGKWSGSNLIDVGARHPFILWLVAQGPKTIQFMNSPQGEYEWGTPGFPSLMIASDSFVLDSIQLNVS